MDSVRTLYVIDLSIVPSVPRNIIREIILILRIPLLYVFAVVHVTKEENR